MLFKRHYNKPEGWEKQVDAAGTCINPPPLAHVECLHTGLEPAQNFSTRMVEGGLREGWISILKGKLVLHVQPEELVYTIKRLPGKYDDEKAPGGYVVINAYECELDAEQHKRFRLPQGKSALSYRAHRGEVANG